MRILTALRRWKIMYRYSHLYCHPIPYVLPLSYKMKCNSGHIDSENNKARILNTLFKVKILALVEQLVALLLQNFPTHFFQGEFPDNCSSEFLLVTGSERLYSKSFLSNTRKAPWDFLKVFFSRKMPILETSLSNVILLIYKNNSPPWKFCGIFIC